MTSDLISLLLIYDLSHQPHATHLCHFQLTYSSDRVLNKRTII